MSGSSEPSAAVFLTLLAIGGFFMAFGVPSMLRSRALRRTGASAVGKVVNIRSQVTDGGTTVYSPVVAWHTPDGREYEYCPLEYSSSKRRFRLGTELVIRYDPANPDHRPKLRGSVGNVLDWISAVVGAAVFCAGLVALVLFLL
ncbi:DUF3592 domain-containing protein [Actinomadura sp. NAK00032]|uniref:DUF3592 domain-containing protein n=1 Tax=Actinomadura sp. NAK00032 TaxID=2742128 RepID=UPI001590CAD2|nr:DUF3592 domain-containing protein [Actinomadura sp. NAK00032]QKW33065.1 DUF3592 domain-containing protein [Actinomadura sp. NAK00032]